MREPSIDKQRHGSQENMEIIVKAFADHAIAEKEGVLEDRELDCILHKAYLNIFYDDILENLIPAPARLIEMLIYFSIDERIEVRSNFLGWMANTYYKEELTYSMETYIATEDYEWAAILRDALLITEMPLVR